MKLFKKKTIKDLLPPPVKASHGEYSMILSSHDDHSAPTEDMIKLGLKACAKAQDLKLEELKDRIPEGSFYLFPGEHYRLLAALTKVLRAKNVVEIGTSTGLSALAILSSLTSKARLTTYDVIPYSKMENSFLTKEDFEDNRLVQYTDDLADEKMIRKHKNVLKSADLIFIDAVHDGIWEEKLMKNLASIKMKNAPYILFDDIKVWKMLQFWRELNMPKLDLTSFGHWSGTGLVKWEA